MQFQLGRYIHACTSETHSSKCTRFNSYLGWFVLLIIIPAKVEIKSCRLARECASFIHLYIKFALVKKSCFTIYAYL